MNFVSQKLLIKTLVSSSAVFSDLTMKDILITNIDDWIKDNKDNFCPPVSNKFLHKHGQLTVMFVGGPNSRCDFHVQQGEEFFYQMKGKALLKVFAEGRQIDVFIEEGEVFLLPARIPHSPQRFKDTMGMVLERKRAPLEIDILRFYVNSENGFQPEILYETTFHWDNASTDMVKCLKEFSESDQCQTGQPKNDLSFDSPFEINSCKVEEPKNLIDWIKTNEAIINQEGRLELFDKHIYKHKIFVYGAGNHTHLDIKAETWMLQLEGESRLILSTDQQKHLLKHDSLLIDIGSSCQILQNEDCYLMVCSQHP